jgi:putative tryptophan/tyrosine transport system substrate-binding protein
LRALGYVEGQNIVIEQRYAAGSYDRVGELAAELVRLNVDVIVVDGPAAAKPAKAATADIPIVFTLATDPVAEGLVASMARPGGNLTGLTLSVGYELVAKRVELLKDIKPDLARLAILRNHANPSAGFYSSEAEISQSCLARGLGEILVDALVFERRRFVKTQGNFPPTFSAARSAARPPGISSW